MKYFVVWQPMYHKIDSLFTDIKKALEYVELLNSDKSLMSSYTITEVDLKDDY